MKKKLFKILFTSSRTFALFCLGLCVTTTCIANKTLSDSARISLVTCAPGNDLYSAFGHNGIRVTDYKNEFDVVFNYGTFSFEQPGFYTNFIKGKMRYMVATDRFSDFIDEYIYEERGVTELELNISSEEKQQLFAALYTNTLPENREYFYDFFWDNCATRPRDLIEKILGNRLQYHTENAGFAQNKTMHDMLRMYVGNRPWVNYGFDLILGLPCEVEATPRNQTFLPDYLEKYFETATLDSKPFTSKKIYLLRYPLPKMEAGFRPIYLSLLLFLIGFIIAYFEKRNKTHYYRFDFLLFITAGLLGTLFLCMWLFTVHYSVPKNLNMLWLIPTHLIACFFLLPKQKMEWLKYYFGFTFLIQIVLLLIWNWSPQPFNIAAMPLVFLLSYRAASITIAIHFKHKV